MKIAVYQARPRLCLSPDDFIKTIDDIVGTLVEEHHPDLISFPECIGLWMCMMRPSSWVSRMFSAFLPKRSSVARMSLSEMSTGWNEDSSSRVAASVQLARPSSARTFSSGRMSLLESVDGFESLMVSGSGDNSLSSVGWVERAANWLFDHLHLRSVGMGLRSGEQHLTYHEAFSGASKKHGVAIQAGSIFAFQNRRLLNIAYTFDRDGSVISRQCKIHPIPFEGMIGVDGGDGASSFVIDGIRCGVAICSDVNFRDDHVRDLAGLGCKIVLCPSGGIVPNHLWKFDFERDVESCHMARSMEEGVVILRPYNAGDLIPGALMFQGRSSITGPRGLIEIVSEDDIRNETVLLYDVEP